MSIPCENRLIDRHQRLDTRGWNCGNPQDKRINMEDLVAIGRSLPIFASAPTLVATFVIMLIVFKDVKSIAAKFVGWTVYIRLAAGALHPFTFQRSPLGVSYNALLSLGICVIGILVIRRRYIFISILPFIPILIVMVVSGIMNGAYSELFTGLIKYVYLVIIIISFIDALSDIGPERLLKLMLFPMALPLCLQFLSVVLHIPKPGETDGADSYIGGYNHEASFSIILLIGILTICLIRNIHFRARLGMIVYSFIAILLANYRTAILSVLPLVVTSIMTAVPRVIVAKQRAIVVMAAIILATGTLVVGAIVESNRFSDLGAASQEQKQGELIRRPETFSPEDQRVLSGRPYIWSTYYYAWYDAPLKQKILGFGPETWQNNFRLYAHNTIISHLYEIGISGVICTILVWFYFIIMSFRIKSGLKLELLAAHASFLILNMATMPLWQIEGIIFYAILCAYTIYCFKFRVFE